MLNYHERTIVRGCDGDSSTIDTNDGGESEIETRRSDHEVSTTQVFRDGYTHDQLVARVISETTGKIEYHILKPFRKTLI